MKYLTLQDVLARGTTYRMIDHWCRRGWLRPAHRGGAGHNREWPQTELRIALMMRRLTAAGFIPEVAAVIARTHLGGRPLVPLGDGLVLAIDTDLPQEQPA